MLTPGSRHPPPLSGRMHASTHAMATYDQRRDLVRTAEGQLSFGVLAARIWFHHLAVETRKPRA